MWKGVGHFALSSHFRIDLAFSNYPNANFPPLLQFYSGKINARRASNAPSSVTKRKNRLAPLSTATSDVLTQESSHKFPKMSNKKYQTKPQKISFVFITLNSNHLCSGQSYKTPMYIISDLCSNSLIYNCDFDKFSVA